eukprot:8987904-Lingulodinium_polyedra.AAC.1
MLVPWEEAMRVADAQVRRRAYVDDLTFWKRGGPDVVEGVAGALAATRRFEEAMDWELNSAKSR